MSSQHTQDSVGDDTGVDGDDADFEVEPSNLMEQSMTTENVPVFADVASSSQAAALALESQQSHHTGSTSGQAAVYAFPRSLEVRPAAGAVVAPAAAVDVPGAPPEVHTRTPLPVDLLLLLD